MAEIFGAVASGAGLVSLSIQLLESAHKLKSFRDAPNTVIRLSSEMETTSLLLAHFERFQRDQVFGDQLLDNCFKNCDLAVARIEHSVGKVNRWLLVPKTRFLGMTYSYMGFREPEIRNLLEDMEHARNSMLLAFSIYHHYASLSTSEGYADYRLRCHKITRDATREDSLRQQYSSYLPTTDSDRSTRQIDMWSSSDGGSLDTMEVDGVGEVLEDISFAEYPAVDTLHDESIACWPTVTCSELGSKRIRLVKIAPGPADSIIECEICKCFLDQAPDYTAISYTWGSPLGFREILIEGHPHRVAKNLWRFLKQVRELPNEKRLAVWFWIDALSVDQSNPQEKLDQVGIIASIFRNAERTIVWLGPPYASSDLALAALDPNSTARSGRTLRTMAGPVWFALHNLCERPYWRRLWVYQELQSARRAELMCGRKLVPLQNFQEYLFDTAAVRLDSKLEFLRQTSAGTMLDLTNDPAKTSLWSLIQKTGHLRCVDPRDKAYAILNTARTGKQGIKADYTVTVCALLNQILRNEHDIASPTSLHVVAMQCVELERLFGEPPNSIFGGLPYNMCEEPVKSMLATNGSKGEQSSHENFLSIHARRAPKSHKVLIAQCLGEWCIFYSHTAIAALVAVCTEESYLRRTKSLGHLTT